MNDWDSFIGDNPSVQVTYNANRFVVGDKHIRAFLVVFKWNIYLNHMFVGRMWGLKNDEP